MTEQEQCAKIYARQHKIYERRIRPLFLNALKKQINPVIEFIQMGGRNPNLDLLIDKTVFRVPLVNSYLMVGQLAAKREYYWMQGNDEKGVLGFLIDKWSLIFRNYAINYAYRIENELSETSKQEVREILEYAYENNLSGDDTAYLIRKKVNQISKWRSRVIARTEATTASNLGKEVGAREWLKEQGQEGYQQWLGREDERERHDHFILNDTIIGIDEQWIVGGESANMPGDTRLSGKQRIQCRCTRMFMSKRRYDRIQAAKT